MEGHGLLRAHHDRVGEAAQQHDEGEQRVHDADPLVIDAGDPFMPEIRQMAAQHDPGDDAKDHEGHDGGGDHRDRLIEGDRRPA